MNKIFSVTHLDHMNIYILLSLYRLNFFTDSLNQILSAPLILCYKTKNDESMLILSGLTYIMLDSNSIKELKRICSRINKLSTCNSTLLILFVKLLFHLYECCKHIYLLLYSKSTKIIEGED